MAFAIIVLFSSCNREEPLPEGVLFEEPYLEPGCSVQQVMSNAKGSYMYHYKGGGKNWIAFKNHNVEYHYSFNENGVETSVKVYVPQSAASTQNIYDYLSDCYDFLEKNNNRYGYTTTTFYSTPIYVDFVVQGVESSYIQYYIK